MLLIINFFNYSLSDSDIKTLIFTLELPLTVDIGLPHDKQQGNAIYCLSAVKKLSYQHCNFEPNEIRVMALSVELARLIIDGEISVSSEIKKDCVNHLFTIKKLAPIFKNIAQLFLDTCD